MFKPKSSSFASISRFWKLFWKKNLFPYVLAFPPGNTGHIFQEPTPHQPDYTGSGPPKVCTNAGRTDGWSVSRGDLRLVGRARKLCCSKTRRSLHHIYFCARSSSELRKNNKPRHQHTSTGRFHGINSRVHTCGRKGDGGSLGEKPH